MENAKDLEDYLRSLVMLQLYDLLIIFGTNLLSLYRRPLTWNLVNKNSFTELAGGLQ